MEFTRWRRIFLSSRLRHEQKLLEIRYGRRKLDARSRPGRDFRCKQTPSNCESLKQFSLFCSCRSLVSIKDLPPNRILKYLKVATMAFFGLSQLGYQDTIREHLHKPGFTPQHHYRSGEFRNPDAVKLPPIDKSELPQASIVPVDQISGYGPGHQGSYVEYTRQRTKHIRNPKGKMLVQQRLSKITFEFVHGARLGPWAWPWLGSNLSLRLSQDSVSGSQHWGNTFLGDGQRAFGTHQF